MVRHAGAGALAEIEADVESLRLHRSRNNFCACVTRFQSSITSFSPNESRRRHFSVRHRHEMADAVWITVHHQEAFLRRVNTRCAASSLARAASERKSGLRLPARNIRRATDTRAFRFLLSEIPSVVRSLAKPTNRGRKVEQRLVDLRSREQDVARTSFSTCAPGSDSRRHRALEIVGAIRGRSSSGTIRASMLPAFQCATASPAQRIAADKIKQHSFVVAADHLILPTVRCGFLADGVTEIARAHRDRARKASDDFAAA